MLSPNAPLSIQGNRSKILELWFCGEGGSILSPGSRSGRRRLFSSRIPSVGWTQSRTERSITFGFPMFNHLSRRPAICASHFLNLELLYISFLPPRPCYWLTHSVTDTFYIRIWLSTSLLKSDWNHPVLLQTWSEWKNLSLQYQIFRRICKPLSTPGDGSATWDLE